jgi:hypothetical protein
MSNRTVTSVWGTDAANELAAIAIDLLSAAPLERKRLAACAQIPWSDVERGRAIMDRHGVPWRVVKADRERRRRELAAPNQRARRAR